MLFVTCNVMLQQRHALLEDSIRLFGFYRECDDFEKWIKDKEHLLQADDSTENMEAAKCKFKVMFQGRCLVLLVYANSCKVSFIGQTERDVPLLWTVKVLT